LIEGGRRGHGIAWQIVPGSVGIAVAASVRVNGM
jgi:spore maturation protein SpmB